MSQIQTKNVWNLPMAFMNVFSIKNNNFEPSFKVAINAWVKYHIPILRSPDCSPPPCAVEGPAHPMRDRVKVPGCAINYVVLICNRIIKLYNILQPLPAYYLKYSVQPSTSKKKLILIPLIRRFPFNRVMSLWCQSAKTPLNLIHLNPTPEGVRILWVGGASEAPPRKSMMEWA